MTGSTDTTADYYRLLGISPNAALEEIRAAYRGKLRLWHPDLVANHSDETRRTATEMTARLNEAYECLVDAERRAAYDSSRIVGTPTTRPTSTPLLVVSPKTLRCEIAPGDTVSLTVDIRTDTPPGVGRPRVHTTDQLTAATFTTTALTAKSARVTLRAATSKLGGHRIYHIPITITWGDLAGTATLVVRTSEHREPGPKSPYRRAASSSSRRHRTLRPNRRVRDVAAIIAGGVVLPLLLAVWAFGAWPNQTTGGPSLVALICAGVICATVWHLTASRLLRQPARLARIGVVWGHLMRWSGWGLVAGCATLVGIPAVLIIVIAIIATPLLGLVVIAFVSSRFDSQSS